MKGKCDRRRAYTSVIFAEVFLAVCFLIASQLKAQDTVLFNTVEIKVVKFKLSELGKKTEHLDSSNKEQFKFNTLNDLLANQSTVFIKSYGPGAIATTALRGGNAAQTAILWNGFNLQNTMLGQTDLSLLPSFLFEDVAIEYGGSSSVWGSGAIAGSIQLNSNAQFGSGNFSRISIGSGSFGKLNSTAQVQFSKKRFISSTKLYLNSAKNNFSYLDTADKETPVSFAKNAAYITTGFMQELKFLIKNNQSVSASVWLNDNKRQLQAIDPQLESKTNQEDNAIRLTAAWTFSRKAYHTSLKSAYFQDKLNYNDSLRSVYSKSTTRSYMIENDNYFQWFRNQQFNLSANVLHSEANSDNYSAKKGMDRISLLAGNKVFFFREKLTLYFAVRFENYSIGSLPVTGNVSTEYKLTRHIGLKFNAAKVYRQATLNELYWRPGGNSELNPEQGYTFEGEVHYSKKIKACTFYVSLAAYSRNIQDWILWVPVANGNPSPTNIQEVWSRGSETTWKLNYQKGNVKTGFSFMSSYVLTTVESSKQENDNSIGKQLIYTPRYVFNANLFFAYKHAELYYFHQYNGYRFTTSDNSAWLDPYKVASLRFNYSMNVNQSRFLIFAACNNFYNQNYAVIHQRPMPLRNYEIGITLQFKH